MYTDIQFTHRVRDVVAIVSGCKSCRAELCVYKTQEKLPGPLVSKQLVIVAAYLKSAGQPKQMKLQESIFSLE